MYYAHGNAKVPCKEFQLRDPSMKGDEIRERLGLPSITEMARRGGGLYQPAHFYDGNDHQWEFYGRYTGRDTIAIAATQTSALERVKEFADFIGDREA